MDAPSLQDQIRTLREKYEAETIDFVRDALRQRIEELEATLASLPSPLEGEGQGRGGEALQVTPSATTEPTSGSPKTSGASQPSQPLPPSPLPQGEGAAPPSPLEGERQGRGGQAPPSTPWATTEPTSGSPKTSGASQPSQPLPPSPLPQGEGATLPSPLEGEGQGRVGQSPSTPNPASTTEPLPQGEGAELTEAQRAEADRLIALARLEKSRGNRPRSTELLQQAAQAAPGAASVLEMLGDDLSERKAYTKARDTYAEALAAEPNNVGLQTKHAEAVLRASGASIEGMLSLDGNLNPKDRDSGAAWIDILAPGLGQCFRGRWGVGIPLLVVWISAVVFVILHNQPRDIGETAQRGNQTLGVVAVLVVIALHLGSLANVLFTVRSSAPKRNIEKPRPPVDLPFE